MDVAKAPAVPAKICVPIATPAVDPALPEFPLFRIVIVPLPVAVNSATPSAGKYKAIPTRINALESTLIVTVPATAGHVKVDVVVIASEGDEVHDASPRSHLLVGLVADNAGANPVLFGVDPTTGIGSEPLSRCVAS